MTARRGHQRITLGLLLLGCLLLATGGVIAFCYIPFGWTGVRHAQDERSPTRAP